MRWWWKRQASRAARAVWTVSASVLSISWASARLCRRSPTIWREPEALRAEPLNGALNPCLDDLAAFWSRCLGIDAAIDQTNVSALQVIGIEDAERVDVRARDIQGGNRHAQQFKGNGAHIGAAMQDGVWDDGRDVAQRLFHQFDLHAVLKGVGQHRFVDLHDLCSGGDERRRFTRPGCPPTAG